MCSIKHNVLIKADAESLYGAISTPQGLSQWWTLSCNGICELSASYQLYFSEEYNWTARIAALKPPYLFHMDIIKADDDWTGTNLIFEIQEEGQNSLLIFEHSGWHNDNAHFRRSSYCWALYLRCLKVLLEDGVSIKYEHRTD